MRQHARPGHHGIYNLGSGSGFSLQFSRDPDQSLLYLIDGTNQRVWVLRRKDLALLVYLCVEGLPAHARVAVEKTDAEHTEHAEAKAEEHADGHGPASDKIVPVVSMAGGTVLGCSTMVFADEVVDPGSVEELAAADEPLGHPRVPLEIA